MRLLLTFLCVVSLASADEPFAFGKQFKGLNNDGREVTEHLPELHISRADSGVVQVVNEASRDIVYTVRSFGVRFTPRVYSDGHPTFTITPFWKALCKMQIVATRHENVG